MAEPARPARPVNDALAEGRKRTASVRPDSNAAGLAALQRAAGNAAVNALLMGKFRAPGKGEIEAALKEMRRDEPAIDIVEKGLKAAKAVGVPVELEGPKPPPSALAVTTTGFGPAAVAPKKPVPPAKPVPAKGPLGKASARPAKSAKPYERPGGGGAKPGPTAAGGGGRAAAPLSGDQLLQPPVPPSSVTPDQDPAFAAVTAKVTAVAKDKRAHPPAAAKAEEAQDAAVAPTDDIASQAKAAKVDTMDAQQAGTFDKKAFVAAVKAAIEAKSPKTLSEADNYAESGKAGEVKADVKGLVTQGKESQAKDIETATAAPPDTSKAVEKPVTPMGPEQQGPAPAIAAAGAVPKPAPPEQLNLAAGKQQANQEMADAQVDEKQLAESNEPEFEQALAAKKEAAVHADTAPGEFRKQEADVTAQTKNEAAAETKAGVAGMQGSKAAALAKLVADKGKTKSKDEAKRAEVTAKIQSIFAAAEADVKKILDGIDPKVEKEFEQGEAGARKTFETYVSAKMSAYKKDRYGGWLGGLRWAKDKLFGMPDKVNQFYEAGRELYLKEMDRVISRVADIVGNDLTAAKKRIAAGKAEIASYVKSLPASLQKVGAEASKEINDRFEQLEDDVKSKQEAVVDTLATKYVEARKGLDERIEELQAENKGLVDKAIGAIKAVINTIRKLAAMLMDTLSRVAGVVGDIIKAPVRFLANLVAGVKGGILRFKDNILEHLRKGLMTWLFGALAEGGVELPDTFDLKGIIKLLASLFGLTWRNIRNRLVKQIGEKAMAAIEKGVEIFQIIAGPSGIAGLWQMLVEKLGDIKEMILEQVKDFVITRIITAGITWLIGLLNPAAAFIKACKLIYDVIMFFVNNAERIAKFVNTVIDSAADIVRGNVGGVVAKIEDVLGQMVPILIGFLASVIGIGGIGQKIREIIAKLQKPVNKAIDFVIKTGLKLAGPIIRGLKGIGGKVKAKVAAGKAWVKGKAEAGKKWVKGKVAALAMAIPRAFGFRAGDETHRVYVEERQPHRVMVASNPTEATALLNHFESQIAQYPETTPPERRSKNILLRDRIPNAREWIRKLAALISQKAPADKQEKAQFKLGNSLKPIFDAVHKRHMALAGKVPKYTTPKGEAKKSTGSVRCVATLLVESEGRTLDASGAKVPGERPYPTGPGEAPAGTDPTREGRTTERAPRTAHALPPDDLLTGQVGGYVLDAPRAEQRSEQRAQIVTRATGDEAPGSHAEARLLAQVNRMIAADSGWAARVRVIEIHISHSPCPACVDKLVILRENLPNARLAIVQWSQLYEGTYPTTRQSLGMLRGRYSLIGPMP